jgi:hypothetical protein
VEKDKYVGESRFPEKKKNMNLTGSWGAPGRARQQKHKLYELLKQLKVTSSVL